MLFLMRSVKLVSTLSFSIGMTSPMTVVELNHRQNEIGSPFVSPSPSVIPPPTLLLHGLDSSSHTWRSILSEIQTPAVAVDLRGCGYTDLGNANDFSPDAIVEDIHAFVSKHEYFQKKDEDKDFSNGEKKKFVICGHSMVRKCFLRVYQLSVKLSFT